MTRLGLREARASVNRRTKNSQTDGLRVEISGRFPTVLGIPPREIKNLLESNPVKSRSQFVNSLGDVSEDLLARKDPNQNTSTQTAQYGLSNLRSESGQERSR